jgi:hypothetical protein
VQQCKLHTCTGTCRRQLVLHAAALKGWLKSRDLSVVEEQPSEGLLDVGLVREPIFGGLVADLSDHRKCQDI